MGTNKAQNINTERSRPVGDAGWYNVSNADGISSVDSCGGKLNAE